MAQNQRADKDGPFPEDLAQELSHANCVSRHSLRGFGGATRLLDWPSLIIKCGVLFAPGRFPSFSRFFVSKTSSLSP
jgi:hypothetical protein